MSEAREYNRQQLEDQAQASYVAFTGRHPNKSRTFVKWVLLVDSITCKAILRVVHGDETGLDRQNLDFEL